ncbi:MAG: Xaa-Pro aminopeptidase [Bacteroidales bacterium]|jgi:Xaa-Pro aminopeptidase|nr:Xaa-Pro aminopeptidase [Bacteroidales bacterium]MDN5329319.1 Xaa-Pro aminopeptidase [Bacteroidales bacterium]NLH52683.1 M24 family metallopeptidase [Bacteroidales bacterium]NPV37434.1 M24 family metallopeptidase [Bacteroidales bacterium]
MRYQPIKSQLFEKNREKLCKLLPPGALAIVNSNDLMPRNGDQYFPFRQHSDMLYLTGITQEHTRLILFPSHPDESMREILFILRPNEEVEIWEGRKLRPHEAEIISGIQHIRFNDQWEATLRDLMTKAEFVYLNRNEYPKFFPEVSSRDDRFEQEVRQKFPLHEYRRLAPLLWKLRAIKEPEEIDLLQKACNVTRDAFIRVLQAVKPGMWEYEVEAEITHEFVRKGCTHAYQPIIAGGINACSLHYNTNDALLRSGDLLLMDIGAEYAHYAADCTRTIPVSGRFSPRQRQVYEAVLRLQRHALTLLVPGSTINEVNAEMNELATREMINLGLFTQNDLQQQDPGHPLRIKYLMHGVTHYTGLDVHDVGWRDQPLEPGMVLTFEPGLYIAEEGIGIRLEDNIVVGYPSYNLMEDIPIEPDEIEEIMNSR